MTPVNILCMKWGTAYEAFYVNRLYSMVKRNLTHPFRFLCFTDDPNQIHPEVEIHPLPEIEVPEGYRQSPWRKLSLFKKDLAGLSGQNLFLDLDLILTDSIDCFFDFKGKDDFCIIENWTQAGQGIGNSSVFRFESNAYDFIFESYAKDPLKICKCYDNEQIFLSRKIQEAEKSFLFWPETWCRSFKRHAMSPFPLAWIREPRIPDGTKILVFHGNPKPDEAAEGRWPGHRWSRFRRATWVYDYWK